MQSPGEFYDHMDWAVTSAFQYLIAEPASQSNRNNNRYPSQEALFEALGDNGYVFGDRPLQGLNFMIRGEEGGLLDRANLQFSHKQIFYVGTSVDGTLSLENRGFFGGGKGVIADPNFPGNISSYRFGPVQQGPLTTQQIESIPGFRPQDYSLSSKNCQHFCTALQQQFGQQR